MKLFKLLLFMIAVDFLISQNSFQSLEHRILFQQDGVPVHNITTVTNDLR